MSNLIKALAEELQAEHLLSPSDTVVVGVSGGPDSMALLHSLLALNHRHGWQLSLHVAHLNHRLRGPAAEQDAAFVQAAADSLALPCTIEAIDVAERARTERTGVEETGRQQRYALFERVAQQVGAQAVAVGHHADDQAETVLHHLIRGTGLRGLAGMRSSRPLSPLSAVRLVRPLLHWSRQDVLHYLSDAGIAYREDDSNESLEPVRNRLRHQLLPTLEADYNPQAREALLRLAEQASWHEEFLRETTQPLLDALVITHTDQTLALNAAVLARKSRILQTELVRLAYTSFGLGEQHLAFAHMVAALELIAGPGGGRQIQLPGGMTVEKRYDQLIFTHPSDEPRETIAEEIAVRCPGRTVLPIRQLEINCELFEVTRRELPPLRHGHGPFVEHVDFQALSLPLVVRPRRPGGRFHPLGAPGSKKISDFLIDAKVAPKERDRVAILCDQLGPVWGDRPAHRRARQAPGPDAPSTQAPRPTVVNVTNTAQPTRAVARDRATSWRCLLVVFVVALVLRRDGAGCAWRGPRTAPCWSFPTSSSIG